MESYQHLSDFRHVRLSGIYSARYYKLQEWYILDVPIQQHDKIIGLAACKGKEFKPPDECSVVAFEFFQSEWELRIHKAFNSLDDYHYNRTSWMLKKSTMTPEERNKPHIEYVFDNLPK